MTNTFRIYIYKAPPAEIPCKKNLCKLNALNIFKDTALFRPTEKLQLGPDPISGVKDKDKRIVKVGNRAKNQAVTFLARMVEIGGICLPAEQCQDQGGKG